MRARLIAISLLLLLASPLLAQRRSTTTTIPDGTPIAVRVIDNLSSATAKAGQTFRGTLYQPIVVNGRTVYPKGADVVGRVQSVHPSGRLSDPGVLVLDLRSVSYNGQRSTLHVAPYQIKGESHTKSNVEKIGGGAALGAVIGAIAGGGKGAAIGAGVGAAGGTGVAAATGKKDAKVESEAVLEWSTVGSSVSQAAQREPAYNDQARNNAARDERNYSDDRDDDDDRGGRNDAADDGNYDRYMFSSRDRQSIRNCFADNYDNLPPGLAKRDRLPPGLERQLERNGTLPPGLQKRVQPLPGACDSQLPRLPSVLRRVVYAGHIMLLNQSNRILDMFLLGSGD